MCLVKEFNDNSLYNQIGVKLIWLIICYKNYKALINLELRWQYLWTVDAEEDRKFSNQLI